MKRISKLLLVFAFVFTLMVESALAEVSINTKEFNVTYEQQEISDIDVLREKAKKGETDLNVNLSKALLKDSQTNKVLGEIDTYSTTQILQVLEDKNNNKIIKYVTTAFSDVDPDLMGEDKGEFDINGDLGDDEVHNGVVRSYSRIYWESYKVGHLTYENLTRVTGGWEKLDSTWVFSNRKVEYGQCGINDGNRPCYNSGSKTPSSNTYSYNQNDSSWYSVIAEEGYHLSSTSYITYTRGDRSYTHVFVNVRN